MPPANPAKTVEIAVAVVVGDQVSLKKDGDDDDHPSPIKATVSNSGAGWPCITRTYLFKYIEWFENWFDCSGWLGGGMEVDRKRKRVVERSWRPWKLELACGLRCV